MQMNEASRVKVSRLIGCSLVVDQPGDVTVSRVTDVIHRHIPEARQGTELHTSAVVCRAVCRCVLAVAGACAFIACCKYIAFLLLAQFNFDENL